MRKLASIAEHIRRLWTRFVLRKVRYADSHGRCELLYAISDPWRMVSPLQQYRFAETNRIILNKYGKQKTLLEIGCGEGHQSEFLVNICDRLVGIDVSRQAILRAKGRCPRAEFFAYSGDLSDLDRGARYDLVLACEVLYYVKDVSGFIRDMEAIGRNLVVTYFGGEMKCLDEILLNRQGASSEVIAHNGTRWRVVCWSVEHEG